MIRIDHIYDIHGFRRSAIRLGFGHGLEYKHAAVPASQICFNDSSRRLQKSSLRIEAVETGASALR